MANRKDYQKKGIWHTLKGEYNLHDGEQLVLATDKGFFLVRYNMKKDVWYDDQGKECVGGSAMLPLPTIEEAISAADKLVEGEPWAKL